MALPDGRSADPTNSRALVAARGDSRLDKPRVRTPIPWAEQVALQDGAVDGQLRLRARRNAWNERDCLATGHRMRLLRGGSFRRPWPNWAIWAVGHDVASEHGSGMTVAKRAQAPSWLCGS
jgi:hypothetical protein